MLDKKTSEQIGKMCIFPTAIKFSLLMVQEIVFTLYDIHKEQKRQTILLNKIANKDIL